MTAPHLPRFVVTLTAAMEVTPSAAAALAGDGLELRLDRCTPRGSPGPPTAAEVREWTATYRAAAPAKQLVATCAAAGTRGAAGSFARGADATRERLQLLAAAARAGADWVDLDAELVACWQASADAPDFGSARLLLSSHPELHGDDRALLFAQLDEELEVLLAAAERLPSAAALKLVPLLDTAAAGVHLLAWLRARRVRWVERGLIAAVFGTGPAVAFTRPLAHALGSAAVYAAAAPDSLVPVPGQPTVAELVRAWPGGQPPRADSPVFGVLGSPVATSLSPELFTWLFAELGFAGVFGRFDLADPGALFAELGPGEGPPWVRGLSVTAPHKGAAWRFGRGATAPPEPGLAQLGALNTLIAPQPGSAVWRGANTDLVGVRAAVAELLGDSRPRDLVVLGAGGAARAVLAALRGRVADRVEGRATVLARDPLRAMSLAREFGTAFGGLADLGGLSPDLLVHTTPAGSAASGAPWVPGAEALAALAVRAPRCCVLDANYAPDPTPLVGASRALGLRAAGGKVWFLAQALEQLTWFTGCAAPAGAAEQLERLLRARRGAVPRGWIVLMGQRGAGKSQLGRALAAKLGLAFADLDDELARRAGVASAGQLLLAEGEAAFRAREAALFEELLEGEPGVLAAGGGTFTEGRARAALGAAGALGIWLDARPEVLARRVAADPTPRPALYATETSPLAEARRARSERAPVFAALAERTFETSALDPLAVLRAVLCSFGADLHLGQRMADEDVVPE